MLCLDLTYCVSKFLSPHKEDGVCNLVCIVSKKFLPYHAIAKYAPNPGSTYSGPYSKMLQLLG